MNEPNEKDLNPALFNIEKSIQSFKDRFVWYHEIVILNKAVFFYLLLQKRLQK